MLSLMSRFKERDLKLPQYRENLLKNAVQDLKNDADVLAIYLGGSLAKGNFDYYSDIDLHIIVTPEKKIDFIQEKRNRPKRWGEVLYYEDTSPRRPVIVVHYDCFVKVDTWYHEPNEIQKSLWMQGLKALHDPRDLLKEVIEQSNLLEYNLSADEVELWRGKIFAYIHEAYRSLMRDECYDAMSYLDKFRWMIARGWYMEKGIRVDSAWGVWSKLEGKRSDLEDWQLSMLYTWHSSLEPNDTMKTISSMIPEFMRLHRTLCQKTGLNENKEWCKKVIGLVV